MRAPNEHGEDPRRLGMVFAAAHARCGLVVCGWCGFWLGIKRELPEGAVSHGICARCEGKLTAEAEAMTSGREGARGPGDEPETIQSHSSTAFPAGAFTREVQRAA